MGRSLPSHKDTPWSREAYTSTQNPCRAITPHTDCPWKGLASYYDVFVGEKATMMEPGTIPIPVLRHSPSRDTLHSGGGSKSIPLSLATSHGPHRDR